MAIDAAQTIDTKAVATLLRGLAFDVEASPALAARVLDSLIALGLLDDDADGLSTDMESAPTPDPVPPLTTDLLGLYAARIDLPTLFHLGGPEGIRQRLATLPFNTLRRLVAMRHLDPDRQTTKLRSATKLIDYIVARVATQVERERELTRTASWML